MIRVSATEGLMLVYINNLPVVTCHGLTCKVVTSDNSQVILYTLILYTLILYTLILYTLILYTLILYQLILYQLIFYMVFKLSVHRVTNACEQNNYPSTCKV